MEPPRSFAELIRARRNEMGLTQAELGRLVGRSASAVAGWEGGKSLPGEEETLGALAAALGISRRELEEVLDPERLSFDPTETLEQMVDGRAEADPVEAGEGGPEWGEDPLAGLETELIEMAWEEAAERGTESVAERQPPPVAERQTVASRRTAPRPDPPRRPLSYLEDPEQVELYRVRYALTFIILLGLLAVAVWATGELREALRDVIELF